MDLIKLLEFIGAICQVVPLFSDRLAAPKTPSKPREDTVKDKPTPPKATPPPRMQPAVPRVVPRETGSHKSPVTATNKPVNKVGGGR